MGLAQDKLRPASSSEREKLCHRSGVDFLSTPLFSWNVRVRRRNTRGSVFDGVTIPVTNSFFTRLYRARYTLVHLRGAFPPMWIRSLVVVALILLTVAKSSCAQIRRALLIGINTYQPAHTTAEHPAGCTGGRCDLPVFENLEGALNDVAAMRDLLASPKFGFAPNAVTVLTNPALPESQLPYVTLPAGATTHDGIVSAMQKYLVDLPQRGDTVVFYYAGHGSLRLNSQGNKLSLMVNGKETHADSTLVPADAWTGGYDVRDREMTRIFNAALDKGVKLTVILDSCHSGAFTRGIPLSPKVRERMLPYDPRDIHEAPDAGAGGQLKLAPAERTDNPALVFSAAQQDQTAKESPTTGSVAEPHGAFTSALIKALEVLPADAPASVVYQQVNADLEGNGIADQTPSLDAAGSRRQQPLFGGATEQAGKLRAAVVSIDDDGNVVLDTGRLAGIGPGTTFLSFGASNKSEIIALKVTDLDGIAHSKATVVSPSGAHVAVGQVFEIDKWTPVPADPLHFWTWPSTIAGPDLQKAIEQVRASGIETVADPAEQPWTHILLWNSAHWILQRAGTTDPVELGWKLTADALKKNVPAGAKVWINLPPSQELGGKLNLHEKDSMVLGVADAGLADYVLAGTLTRDGPAWAWYHKAEFEKGPPDPHAPRHSPGCSSTANYPVRTDWVGIADASLLPGAAGKLSDYAARLAKLAGWLRLPSSPGASDDDYYHLDFMRVSDQTLLGDHQPVQQGDRLKLVLNASSRVLEKRWVYVLDIDCHGEGNLLYPLNYSENRFPNDANDQRQIVLPGAPTLKVGSPFGLDTILMISTSEPLSDPYILSFKGVGTRGAVGPQSPLERLLSGASSGTRGLDLQQVPTNWSVSIRGLQSVPADAP
ncbi:MAG TPA: caspase family protein [Terracidiphilus sp.]|nr:caspase family protein [Terracidiphilus sp.]